MPINLATQAVHVVGRQGEFLRLYRQAERNGQDLEFPRPARRWLSFVPNCPHRTSVPTTSFKRHVSENVRYRSAAFSASSRLFDLNGKANSVRQKQISAIIAAEL